MGLLKADQIRNAAGTGNADLFKQWASKSWINMRGADTIVIRDSRNVASITDVGVGQYYSNFTSAMSNALFAQSVNGGPSTLWIGYLWDARTAARAEYAGGFPSNTSGGITLGDVRDIHGSVQGDLA